MRRAHSRRFGRRPKRPRARRPAGPDLRRGDGGAVVARPGPGPPQSQRRSRSAGENHPRRTREKPPIDRLARGCGCLPAAWRDPHCLALGAAAAAVSAAASATPRLAARSSPGWRGMRLRARGWVGAHAAEPSSPPRRGGGTTAPSPARRRSGPFAPAGPSTRPLLGCPPPAPLCAVLRLAIGCPSGAALAHPVFAAAPRTGITTNGAPTDPRAQPSPRRAGRLRPGERAGGTAIVPAPLWSLASGQAARSGPGCCPGLVGRQVKAAEDCRTPKNQSGTGVPHSKRAKAAPEVPHSKKPKRHGSAALQMCGVSPIV